MISAAATSGEIASYDCDGPVRPVSAGGIVVAIAAAAGLMAAAWVLDHQDAAW